MFATPRGSGQLLSLQHRLGFQREMAEAQDVASIQQYLAHLLSVVLLGGVVAGSGRVAQNELVWARER